MLAHLQPSLSAADPLHSASWRGDQAILIATSLASAPDLRQPRAVGGACSVCVLQVFGPAAVSNDLAVSASVQATVSPRRRLLTAAAQYQVQVHRGVHWRAFQRCDAASAVGSAPALGCPDSLRACA